MSAEGYRLRLARPGEEQAIIRFVNTHWGEAHPLVNRQVFFEYYYKSRPGQLNFVLAEQGETIAALAGFIDSNSSDAPDGWVSLLLADKAAGGAGLELLCGMQEVSGHRFLACHNIRPRVQPLYRFAGYTTGRVGHYYRLARRDTYQIASVQKKHIFPVKLGKINLVLFNQDDALLNSGFLPPETARPYKDLWYIRRRYFQYPGQQYKVYGLFPACTAAPAALLVLRPVSVEGEVVLRLVDFIGPLEHLAEIQGGFDQLLTEYGAEYIDCYCVVPDETLLPRAGFVPRGVADANIIPNYLEPLLRENTEYYYAAQSGEAFTLFKADGDQDRPR